MRRFLRWIGIVLAGLLGLVVIACGAIYVLSERAVGRTYPIPTATIAIPSDPAAIAEGKRLATIHGCYSGCHGKQAEGGVMIDDPMLGRIVAPNLTAAVRRYNDAQLVGIIRQGVRPDGRAMFIMPSDSFAFMNDADLGRILAFLKTLPPVDGPDPTRSMGPMGRVGVAAGQFKTTAQLVAERVPLPAAATEDAMQGRYLAQTICAHCHGKDLRGSANPEFTSPPLDVVKGYPADSFRELLRTGVALGGRKLGLMGAWARRNFSQLTDAEIASLHAYLTAFPEAVAEARK
jgi:mono/diheme cytochrome c family protein